ncbi:hypothetical protein SEUCBS140593_006009 [Sporothrix eucalyptigena]|uniref:LysM domain-containing protein n=1 Tax=Sporothrix eucalyptigena TaxID=1812306 RepID=A0ABP0C253_9PEZI
MADTATSGIWSRPATRGASIVAKYLMWKVLVDLFAWNPVLGADCSGLYLDYWVCVGIQPQKSLTLVYPAPATSASIPNPQPAPAHQLHNYYLSRSSDICRKIVVSLGYLIQDEFLLCNAFLDGNCDGLWGGVYYSVSEWNVALDGKMGLPLPDTVSAKAASGVAADTAAACTVWYQTSADDDCNFILAMFGTFSRADFLV